MDIKAAEELVRRLAAALRGGELYSPTHPLVQRAVDALSAAALDALQRAPAFVVGFIGDEVVVDSARLPRGSASLIGFARGMREREIEKMSFARGLTRDEVRGLVAALGDRKSPQSIAERLSARGVRHVTLGRIVVDDAGTTDAGIAAARRVYHTAV